MQRTKTGQLDPDLHWHGWGRTAFATAQERNKPVFLYLTTSWGHAVHVFEQSVLGDPEVRNGLKSGFVSIKVNGMERPDIFERYNQGGWPSICFLTPSGDLLLGRAHLNRQEMLQLLAQVAKHWRENHEEITQKAEQQGPPALPRIGSGDVATHSAPTLDLIRQDALAFFDTRHHGFGRAPKFPLGELLQFLLEDPDERLRLMALDSMDTMANSALFDHLEGGFFRASEAEDWTHPHFEKLLETNSLLLEAYLEAFRQTEGEQYQEIAQRTLAFLVNSLGDETGLFASVRDSDGQPGNLGSYYGWSEKQIREAVEDPVTTALLITHFGVSNHSRILGDPEHSFLERRVSAYQAALRMGMEHQDAQERLQDGETRLRLALADRDLPAVTDGYFVADQGRILGSLALAGILLERPLALQRAFEIADLVWNRARDEGGALHHEVSEREQRFFLSDQVEVIHGLLELYRVAGRGKDLVRAVELAKDTRHLFLDGEGPGCLDVFSQGEEWGAVAQPYAPFNENSRWLHACVLIANYTGETPWHEYALELSRALEPMRKHFRLRDAAFGRALRRLVRPLQRVDLITGEGSGEMRKRLLRESPPGTLIRAFDPDQVTPWTAMEKYESNGSQARAAVYIAEKAFEPTHDVDLALYHLNEGE